MITETVEREQNLKQIDQKYQRLINILKCISQPGVSIVLRHIKVTLFVMLSRQTTKQI